MHVGSIHYHLFTQFFNNIYFLGVHKFWNLAEKVSGEVMSQNMTKHQSKEHVASDPFWAWFYDFHIFEVMKKRQDMTVTVLGEVT